MGKGLSIAMISLSIVHPKADEGSNGLWSVSVFDEPAPSRGLGHVISPPVKEPSLEELTQTVQILLQQNYSAKFNFFFAQPIDEIISDLPFPHVILYKDFQYDDLGTEHLRRYFTKDEVNKRISGLTEYYESNYRGSYPNVCLLQGAELVRKRNDRIDKLKLLRNNDPYLPVTVNPELTLSEEESDQPLSNESVVDANHIMERILPVNLEDDKLSFESSVYNIYAAENTPTQIKSKDEDNTTPHQTLVSSLSSPKFTEKGSQSKYEGPLLSKVLSTPSLRAQKSRNVSRKEPDKAPTKPNEQKGRRNSAAQGILSFKVSLAKVENPGFNRMSVKKSQSGPVNAINSTNRSITSQKSTLKGIKAPDRTKVTTSKGSHFPLRKWDTKSSLQINRTFKAPNFLGNSSTNGSCVLKPSKTCVDEDLGTSRAKISNSKKSLLSSPRMKGKATESSTDLIAKTSRIRAETQVTRSSPDRDTSKKLLSKAFANNRATQIRRLTEVFGKSSRSQREEMSNSPRSLSIAFKLSLIHI
eukprot:TRINITY_DN1474_c0_g1_i4.p1 TRINITY_DN1474_c0_g1~~TRINITY_DN1474_c0_g1_i4.p1  ORF type:complete len:528 (-),score=58.59 TRINITY_DN1474_c0_g1_i4:61-1644(-)